MITLLLPAEVLSKRYWKFVLVTHSCHYTMVKIIAIGCVDKNTMHTRRSTDHFCINEDKIYRL